MTAEHRKTLRPELIQDRARLRTCSAVRRCSLGAASRNSLRSHRTIERARREIGWTSPGSPGGKSASYLASISVIAAWLHVFDHQGTLATCHRQRGDQRAGLPCRRRDRHGPVDVDPFAVKQRPGWLVRPGMDPDMPVDDVGWLVPVHRVDLVEVVVTRTPGSLRDSLDLAGHNRIETLDNHLAAGAHGLAHQLVTGHRRRDGILALHINI